MKKKFLWVLLVALLASGLGFVSCGGDVDVRGTWEVKLSEFANVLAEVEEMDVDEVLGMLEEFGFDENFVFFELKFTATNFTLRMIDLFGGEGPPDPNDELINAGGGTYTVDGDTVTLTAEGEGETVTCIVDGNRLTMDIEGFPVVFTKK